MELCKYNEYRLYAYKNIKLPDASSRKYRKICLMACIYACIFRIKIYTMYLWDTFGKYIWRGSIVTHERIKKRIYYYYNTPSLPLPLPPPRRRRRFRKFLRHACETTRQVESTWAKNFGTFPLLQRRGEGETTSMKTDAKSRSVFIASETSSRYVTTLNVNIRNNGKMNKDIVIYDNFFFFTVKIN